MKLSRNNGKDYLVYREGQNDTVEIYDLAVMSERRKGIGTELVNELKEKEKNIYAFMRQSNKRAKKFYEKNGFKAYLIPKFYPDEGAYIMLWSAQ